ncbi:hypothetical protein ACA910_004612 [Epithemia clementina (nom. ined.)]
MERFRAAKFRKVGIPLFFVMMAPAFLSSRFALDRYIIDPSGESSSPEPTKDFSTQLSVLSVDSQELSSDRTLADDNKEDPQRFQNQTRIDSTHFFKHSTTWNETCRRVKHVCFSTGRWWYKSVPGVSVEDQPRLRFSAHLQNGAAKVAYPKEILLQPESASAAEISCVDSPLPNHLVLAGRYNEMLGEFYSRNLAGLHNCMSQPNAKELMEATQVYLQSWNLDRPLLDSHYTFMAPYVRHPLRNFRELLQSTSCNCVENLILCGYYFKNNAKTNDTNVTVNSLPLSLKTWRPSLKEHAAVYKDMYSFLQQTVITNNTFVQEDIAAFRRQFFRSQKLVESVHGNYDDWKIIGLSKRRLRRQWLNLPDVLKLCDSLLRPKKILCMEVNVEDAEFHPTHHAVVHASLDGLIGIHGAQLTDAIWMKPGSLVVEILPFLPTDVRYGSWTREVRQSTPLGIIFQGTDLYHVGLPLTFESVPQCANKKGKQAVECIRHFYWDKRDFVVNPNDIVDAITSFLAGLRPASCQEQKNLAGDYRFVLYNVHCRDDDDGDDDMKNTTDYDDKMDRLITNETSLHHFYWDKDLSEIPIYTEVPQA